MNNRYYVEKIKDRVTMHDVVSRYGFKVGHNKRIQCPFHKGEDFNLGYKKDFFKCFVCGENGDVITFVQKYHGLSFSDTLIRMDDDFYLGLGICNHLTDRERMRIAKEAFEEKLKRKKEQMHRARLDEAYHNAYDEFARLDRQLIEHKPKADDEDLHPLYIEALQNIEGARYKLECAEKELHEYEQRNYTNT